MLDEDVLEFTCGALPPPPARVLEVGAGKGELAAALRARGWEVVAIDPAGADGVIEPAGADGVIEPAGGDGVIAVSLAELDAPARSFDAAVAVVSLHHVQPLERSCARLAELLRPGAVLVVDEFDVQAFDLRAARWWAGHHRELGGEEHDPATVCQTLRAELHPLQRIRDTLAEQGFELNSVRRGPYLYRWDLAPQLRATETEAIAGGALPAVGARFTARLGGA